MAGFGNLNNKQKKTVINMPQTSKEVVRNCLQFANPERMPRDLWVLPWADIHYPKEVKELLIRFPIDFVTTAFNYTPLPGIKGDRHKSGYYVDEWGCVFKNLQDGMIGEVKIPIIPDISDRGKVKPPYQQLPTVAGKAYEKINRFYENSDKFVLANICPRPWERYQFLRGSENALVDVMFPEQGTRDLLQTIHQFYLTELEFWLKADFDGIWFMDDWGMQNKLLISPDIWRDLFKPLYQDYCDLAKSYGKFVFMHSDGHISEILEDIVEIGVDAINSQLFCMDLADLENRIKGKITFWGEIDRQHVLPSNNPQNGRDAVRKVAKHLYDPSGGIIAQFEFGAGTNPDTAFAVFEEWEKVDSRDG